MLDPGFHEALLGAVFGDDHSPVFPDVWFLGFLDAAGDELTQNGYERTAIPNTSDVWELDGDTVSNLEPIDAGIPWGAWPLIGFVVLFDATGAEIFRRELEEPYSAAEGVPVSFDAGGVVVSLGLVEEEEE